MEPFDLNSMFKDGGIVVPKDIDEAMFRPLLAESINFAIMAVRRSEGKPIVSAVAALQGIIEETGSDAKTSYRQLSELIDVWPDSARIEAFGNLSCQTGAIAGAALGLQLVSLLMLFVTHTAKNTKNAEAQET